MKTRVTDYALYRWRYPIGYVCIVALVVLLLGVTAFYVPGALRVGEEQSAVQSGVLSLKSLTPSMVIDLPYHLLQRLSFLIFDVSTFTIKLPSVLIGTLTLVGIFFLIRTWFRPNIAIIVTLISITTAQFLFLLQDGTPNIMFTFLATWLLAIGTYITRAKYFGTFWKVAGCVLMALALYTPLGIYLVAATATTALLHPHIRHVIRGIARTKLALAIVLGLLSITPLVYAIIIEPKTALTLLGIPSGSFDLKANLVTIVQNLTGMLGANGSYLLQPVFSLGVILLALIGIYRLFTMRHTAHSYVITIMGGLLLPLVVLEPMHIIALYPLIILAMAMGVEYIIYSWYKLFPRNPYARVIGLIPLGVFIVGMIFSGITRYSNNYIYTAEILDYYTTDLKLVNRSLKDINATRDTTKLVVPADKYAFYSLVADYSKNVVVTRPTTQLSTNMLVLRDVKSEQAIPAGELVRIVTSRRAEQSDRLYIYKLDQK